MARRSTTTPAPSYFGARYYDPTLGRFMGIDPQHFTENNLHSFNRYAYGNNNPLKFVDPGGRAGQAVLLLLGIGYVAYELSPLSMPIMPAGNDAIVGTIGPGDVVGAAAGIRAFAKAVTEKAGEAAGKAADAVSKAVSAAMPNSSGSSRKSWALSKPLRWGSICRSMCAAPRFSNACGRRCARSLPARRRAGPERRPPRCAKANQRAVPYRGHAAGIYAGNPSVSYQPVVSPPSVAINTYAMMQGSVPRLLQLWSVPRCTTTSPGVK